MTSMKPAEQIANKPVVSELSRTIISSNSRVRIVQALRDVVEYRELLLAFILRSLKIRYKQTALGIAWVILQPLVAGVVFAAILGLIRGRFSGIDALLFFMSGLVPWMSFQNSVQMAAMSLEVNANLVSKVYFPRMTVPASQVISSIVDFLVAFVVLIVVAVLGKAFKATIILWMLPLLAIQLVAALGLGLFFAAMNAQYRDVKYIVPFLLQLGMFITVWIPLESWRVGEVGFGHEWAWFSGYVYEVLSLNPMAAVVETFRAVLDGKPVNWVLLAKGTMVSFFLLVLGVRFFASREKLLADVL